MDAQLKRGVLDLCVLSQLRKRDMYGYELTETIASELEITAGTLYLVLKRLKDNAYVETYLVESSSGPARKYYHITSEGIRYQEAGKKEWEDFVERTGRLL
ncbi:MAG: PadR family transcriptional regulator [Erysipelotrichaceae bacterium]|nr:PadR family transcriptional regulator [Erysipelotrichaceae bacterium]